MTSMQSVQSGFLQVHENGGQTFDDFHLKQKKVDQRFGLKIDHSRLQ